MTDDEQHDSYWFSPISHHSFTLKIAGCKDTPPGQGCAVNTEIPEHGAPGFLLSSSQRYLIIAHFKITDNKESPVDYSQ
ncbi:hypothetical protein [Enterocloster clostridioformis]|uniref:hypothetical protein n=1 Tax=Enterocloster clostridioformis TaxID=1531 RepID=UPI0011BF12D1|nr:hypothetical protein [Enterocloster clostridioformis]MCA5579624.1 hypothetical protein [Enterocloster clostridioformis]